ncbi:MAG: 30S ribosomal protein S12 methylthiotransferase RimO, partial [Lachnospiraceae bacterium]|nr:30S ribosomal protein S12 methylthiotransferase RimO [Lachnospiraceae bacterium]
MKIYFVSLGCDKNRVDSEMMLGILSERGHEITFDETEADAVVINTCAFIHDAKEESINTILEMAELKKTGHLKYLIAAGCLAERYKDEMLEEIDELDAIVGTAAYADIADALEACEKGTRPKIMRDIDSKPVYAKRIVTTVNHFAYLKIAEGCDKHCTYCIIPSLRGRYRSIPMED